MIALKELERKGQRLWPEVLRSALTGNELFPWLVPLGTPRGQQISDQFEALSQWLKDVRAYSKLHGLSLREMSIKHRSLGEQRLPTHLVFHERDQYLDWMKRRSSFNQWLDEAQATIAEFPQIRDWLLDHAMLLEKHLGAWPAIRSCLGRFAKGTYQHLYLRELDIPSVDSKFVETHRMLLTDLLSMILSPADFDPVLQPSTVAKFCQKFDLRFDQPLIRFRCLDHALLHETGGFRDLAVPLSDFSHWSTQARTIFITENKINGLSFPDCPSSLVIFGLGGGIDLLKDIPWLHSKRLIYWGDIDSHGFAILARLRKHFPKLESFLMDEATFLLGREFWVIEGSPYRDALDESCLTHEEQKMLAILQNHHYGESLRLEQERIPFAKVHEGLMRLPLSLQNVP